MKIKKMVLENFQGIKKFVLEPNGENIEVYGDNGQGKTTLFNAFCWLLYGKASTSEKNYTPQTTGTHHLNHIAEAVVELDDGSEMVLKKDYHEKYQTQRGSADSVFTGYTTDFYINSVPTKESDYKKALTEVFQSEDIAKQLTRPGYFLEDIPIKDRRKLLLEMCVDISPEELVNRVIQSEEQLKELPGILAGKEIEDYVKIAASQKKRIDAELKQIPARIDEAEKSKPESLVSSIDRTAINTAIDALKERKKEIERQISAVDVTAESELRKQIAEIEVKRAEAYADYKAEVSKGSQSINQELGELENEKIKTLTAIKNLKEAVSDRQAAYERHKKSRDALRTEYKEVAAKEWTGDTICPTCGRPLPAEQIEEAKKAFNLKKSENLERIKAEGSKVSAEILEKEQSEIVELENKILAQQESVTGIEEQIAQTKASREDPTPFDGSEYDAKISEIKDKLKDVESASEGVKADLIRQSEEIEKELEGQQELLSDFAFVEQQDKRIAELAAKEKELAAEFEKLEKGLYLCEKYNRAKAEMLTDDINRHFKTLKFRLFQEQINGGIADDCEALIPCHGVDVPFKSANTAAKINAGLEVIDTLSDHYGFTLPIFIDGCESINEPRETQAQQIRLYVSNDKELKVGR